MRESHDVSYVSGGIYVNGNRTQDTCRRDSPTAAVPCQAAPCTTKYVYDARDRLTDENTTRDNGALKANSYTLDAAGNVVRQAKHDQPAVRFRYQGNQLREQLSDTGTVLYRFHYQDGDLQCVVKASSSDCGSGVVQKYSHDLFHRLLSSTKYNEATGAQERSSSYVYDALDRPVEEKETHANARVDIEREAGLLG